MRILLIRLSSLGDIVLVTPAIAFIKELAPDAVIDFLCYAEYAPLLNHDPDIARILAFPKKELTRLLTRLRLIRFTRVWRAFRGALRAFRYDHVIDLHNVTDSALLALQSGKAARTGNKRQLLTLFFTRRVVLEDRNERAETHASLIAMLTILESGVFKQSAGTDGSVAGGAEAERAITLPAIPISKIYLDAGAVSEAERFLREHGLAGPSLAGINPQNQSPAGPSLAGINPQNQSPAGPSLAGINPTASSDFKRWPAEKFARVAKNIHETWGCPIILFGAEADRALLEDLRARIIGQSGGSEPNQDFCVPLFPLASASASPPRHPSPSQPGWNNPVPERAARGYVHIACGLPLPTVCALIARLDFLIGADSGLMHIAAAFDIPQVALFGHSSLLKFYPLSGKAHVIHHNLPCAPCTPRRARKCREKKCMRGIAEGEVWREVLTLAAAHLPDMSCRCGDTKS